MTDITPPQRRALRAQAHHLHPVVSIGQHGLTAQVLHEIHVALAAHGLIKVRVHSDDRAAREAMLAEIAERTHASPVQHLGKLLVLWRERDAEPEAAPATVARPRKAAKTAKAAKPRKGTAPRATARTAQSSAKGTRSPAATGATPRVAKFAPAAARTARKGSAKAAPTKAPRAVAARRTPAAAGAARGSGAADATAVPRPARRAPSPVPRARGAGGWSSPPRGPKPANPRRRRGGTGS